MEMRGTIGCLSKAIPSAQSDLYIDKTHDISAYLSSTVLFCRFSECKPCECSLLLTGFHKALRAQLAQMAAALGAGEPLCQSYFPQGCAVKAF